MFFVRLNNFARIVDIVFEKMMILFSNDLRYSGNIFRNYQFNYFQKIANGQLKLLLKDQTQLFTRNDLKGLIIKIITICFILNFIYLNRC